MIESQSYSESAPMDTIGTDLFSQAGKDYLIAVDRFSGYIMCSDIIKNTNSANIIKILNNWFNILGFPKTIRSDGEHNLEQNLTISAKITISIMNFFPYTTQVPMG